MKYFACSFYEPVDMILGEALITNLFFFGIPFRPLFSIAEHKSTLSESKAKEKTVDKTATLDEGEDDELTITGYERSISRTILCWMSFIATAGLLRLFMHWKRHWQLLATHKPCGLDRAQMILVREHFEGKHTVHYVKKVFTLNAEIFRYVNCGNFRPFIPNAKY